MTRMYSKEKTRILKINNPITAELRGTRNKVISLFFVCDTAEVIKHLEKNIRKC